MVIIWRKEKVKHRTLHNYARHRGRRLVCLSPVFGSLTVSLTRS